MLGEAVRKIADVKELGVSTFESAIRTDSTFVKAQDTLEIKKSTKAYEDITAVAIELLGLGEALQ